MRGFPMQATSALKAVGRQRKLKKGERLKSEIDELAVTPRPYKEGSISEKITDLEDRIEFLNSDISNQEGDATNKQKKDLAALKKRLAKLRDQRDKDQDKYSQLNPKNPDRD